MKRGGGGAKGSAYERTIAQILTDEFYPDNDGMFQRVYGHPIPVKGTVKNDLKAMRRYVVDGEETLVLDASWPFSVECKNYKAVDLPFAGYWKKESDLWSWMAQAEEAAKNKMPLVVFRLFRTPDFAMINGQTFGQLHALFGYYKKLYYTIWRQELPNSQTLHVFLLSEFLDWIDWGVFKATHQHKYIHSLIQKGE